MLEKITRDDASGEAANSGDEEVHNGSQETNVECRGEGNKRFIYF